MVTGSPSSACNRPVPRPQPGTIMLLVSVTACEPSAMSGAVALEVSSGDVGYLSCGVEDGHSQSHPSLEDVTNESAANESSEEESANEKEEEATEDIAHTQAPAVSRPNSLAVSSPPAVASDLWTARGDGEVKLRMSESGPGAEPALTVHQMFHATVERYPDHTALGWKEGDAWKTLNYRQYYKQCRTAAKAFLKLGLERYHGVGILGFNSAEWFIADIAAILAGGFAVGIYTTNSAEACQYVAENCQANILVVENHKQMQKILQVQDSLPHLKAIIQYRDELKEKKPNLYTWAEFMALGEEGPEEQLDDIISSQKANQCCTLIYTSGTTGQPKGVMLSHDNLTWTAFATSRNVRLTEACVSQEVVVSYLPLSHIAAQMIDIWITIKVGGATYFAQPDALKVSWIVFVCVCLCMCELVVYYCSRAWYLLTDELIEFSIELEIDVPSPDFMGPQRRF
ncbi:long-chain-fatty-acid--CoA ligase ACSBG2-like isoform X2 [Engraulis encrasicolus]|uniref:long-chain-fatty-acid--CoA ligase ACSBG2-like isoform X2 n=1 Tax=Engraulis encrasicolus TaxID=184585 RepID=UPI002FCF76BF